MEYIDLRAALQCLHKSVDRMKSLLAWEQLKQSEQNPARPPAFQMHDPTETDLRNESSFFLASLATMHESLDADPKAISIEERRDLKRELLKLEQAVQALNLHRRSWRS